MASQQVQPLPVDADLPSPTIELQSFEARNEYSNIQSDDDPATPLAPLGSREPLVAEITTSYPHRLAMQSNLLVCVLITDAAEGAKAFFPNGTMPSRNLASGNMFVSTLILLNLKD